MVMSTKYYISGKISNGGAEPIEENLKRFNEVAQQLRAQGHEVFNPAELEVEGGASWEYYLARDLKWIYENRPTLYVLPNWKESQGARLEVEWGQLLGLDIQFVV